jgi:hypothetical protein
MGILRKYVWLVLSIVFIANYAIADTCENDPYTCTPTQLCSKTTEKIDNDLYWISSEEDKHLKVAQKIKLNCGAKDAMSSCQSKAEKCGVLELCKIATIVTGSETSWSQDRKIHVKLAKSFGLNCGVSNDSIAEIDSKPKILTLCDKKPAACISETLCEKAADTSSGQVEWRVKTAPEHVKEAKKRKLDCKIKAVNKVENKVVSGAADKEVSVETTTLTEQTQNLFNKADFKKLRLAERKQLQYGLKRLGYYNGTIDGLYGPMSQNAVRNYARDKKLIDGYPNSLLTALITEPGIGENFAKYFNQTAHFNTVKYQDYDIFPIYEIICRSVYQAPWVGLKDLDKIKQFLSQPNNKCSSLSYQDVRFFLGDMPEAGVRIDLDNDGIRDLLVFLYGFQQGAPLKMVGFKFGKEKTNNNQSPIVRLFRADEIFASGEYPTVQNARFISVSDFNSDGKPDIVISDGGYDAEPRTAHFSKILLSSPKGFVERNIGPKRKRHGAAAADVNGDGYIDVLFGRSAKQPSGMWESLSLYMNDGKANFKKESNRLPKELIRRDQYQPIFVEFLDIDGDGFVDLVSGQSCGKLSKIFWNDGRGVFTNKNSTIIPLDYSKKAGSFFTGCEKKGFYNTIDQVYLVSETETNKRYFGVIASERWKGRNLSLFKINGRSFSPSLTSKESPNIEASNKYRQFAYKLNYRESQDGHQLDIYDFQFKKVSLKFNIYNETYTKTSSSQNTSTLFNYKEIMK